jgi:hypothetical protein
MLRTPPPVQDPITIEMKVGPLCSAAKEHTLVNMYGMATNKEYIVAELKATYTERNMTKGSINSMCIGRVSLIMTNNFKAATLVGPVGEPGITPTLFIRRASIVFLCVSPVKKTPGYAVAMKKRRVH